MQKQKRRPFATCRFGLSHHRGLECLAVTEWREHINTCGDEEVVEGDAAWLVFWAPQCLATHGTRTDQAIFYELRAAVERNEGVGRPRWARLRRLLIANAA